MTFLLYETKKAHGGDLEYRRVKNDVVLAGNGLIYQAAKKFFGDGDIIRRR
jgi:hypothetical protein